ncbi:MAG: hypothetical protein K0V04_14875 [Deltaproteobacteria bacterium]|nr:hypothetical protein [Deltaproteobacteria bacterium]
MPWLPLVGLLLATATTTATTTSTPAKHETSAERLHRKGVHCMEVIERTECAIDNFEALLDEDTIQRELLTDGMLRLMTLYRREGRQDDIGPLLRRFWDVGRGRKNRGHLPYSARFVPSELNVLINIDPPRVTESALLERQGPDLRDYLFTCDEVRRNDIQMKQRWRRAARIAADTNRETWEVFYEGLDEEAAKKAEYEAKRKAKPKAKPDPDADLPPLMVAASCPLVEALGQRDSSAWLRMTNAAHHRERGKTAALFQLDDLETHLAAAVEAGRLVETGPGRWSLPGFDYGGRTMVIGSLDMDELVVAPLPIFEQMQQARLKRKRTMNRELDRLVGKVPRDTGVFMVLNQAALRELGFGSMQRRSTRGFFEALLPRPKGLQVAAIVGDSIGLFTRVPTDSAVRGRMLVSLANTMLARSDDPDAAKWVEGLDVAEAADRKALLASYVVTGARLEEILWD